MYKDDDQLLIFWKRGLYIYRLKGYGDDFIEGNVYEGELQKRYKDNDQLFKIKNVLKERGRNGACKMA